MFLCCVALIVLFYLSAQYLVVTAAPTILFSLPYSPSSRTFILPLGIMRLHALCHSLASPSCKDRSTIRTVPSNSTDPSTITLFSIISCMKTNSEDNDPSTQCFSYTGSSTEYTCSRITCDCLYGPIFGHKAATSAARSTSLV